MADLHFLFYKGLHMKEIEITFRRRATLLAVLVALIVGVSLPAAADATSSITATVTPRLMGGFVADYLYEYTLHNTSAELADGSLPIIVDFEVPIFSRTDVTEGTLTSPPGWFAEIIDPSSSTLYYNNPDGPFGDYEWSYDQRTDPLLDGGRNPNAYGSAYAAIAFEHPPLIIHWRTCTFEWSGGTDPSCGFSSAPLDMGQSLSGFSYLSPWPERPAPYQASFMFLPPSTGDPPIPGQPGFSTPYSPSRQAAEAEAEAAAQLPESSSSRLLLLAGVAIAFARRLCVRFNNVN